MRDQRYRMRNQKNFKLRSIGLVLAMALSYRAHAVSPIVVPSGATVANGNVSITAGDGGLTVQQNSQSAIVNWNSFSIAPNLAVTFIQPNGSSVILNRVTGGEASQIQGSIISNGKVFLVNPNGILFSNTSQINVGSIVASTLDITDSNFNSGKLIFERTSDGSATVTNQGSINAVSGYVALLSNGDVRNEGTIVANGGTVVLGAGRKMTLDLQGDGLMQVMIDIGDAGVVTNTNLIRADGGKIMLVADPSVIQMAVNQTGIIQATSLATHNGEIVLSGGTLGQVNVDGVTSVKSSSGMGGKILISGQDINVSGELVTDGHGPLGTGTITLNATNNIATTNSAVLEASVFDVGGQISGGSINITANGAASIKGLLQANGGPAVGDGGNIQITATTVDISGAKLSVSAPAGKLGTINVIQGVSSLPSANPGNSDTAVPPAAISFPTVVQSSLDASAIVNKALVQTVSLMRNPETTYIYDSNIRPVSICSVTDLDNQTYSKEMNDLLSREWSRVRGRPKISNCFQSDHHNSCADL